MPGSAQDVAGWRGVGLGGTGEGLGRRGVDGAWASTPTLLLGVAQPEPPSPCVIISLCEAVRDRGLGVKRGCGDTQGPSVRRAARSPTVRVGGLRGELARARRAPGCRPCFLSLLRRGGQDLGLHGLSGAWSKHAGRGSWALFVSANPPCGHNSCGWQHPHPGLSARPDGAHGPKLKDASHC